MVDLSFREQEIDWEYIYSQLEFADWVRGQFKPQLVNLDIDQGTISYAEALALLRIIKLEAFRVG